MPVILGTIYTVTASLAGKYREPIAYDDDTALVFNGFAVYELASSTNNSSSRR
jgi:hypothetical protein